MHKTKMPTFKVGFSFCLSFSISYIETPKLIHDLPFVYQNWNILLIYHNQKHLLINVLGD